MQKKRMSWGVVVAAVMAATAGPAAAQERPRMSSIIIDRAVDVQKKPLSKNERDYWRCVLEHLKGTYSDEAVNVILAACRKLHGADYDHRRVP